MYTLHGFGEERGRQPVNAAHEKLWSLELVHHLPRPEEGVLLAGSRQDNGDPQGLWRGKEFAGFHKADTTSWHTTYGMQWNGNLVPGKRIFQPTRAGRMLPKMCKVQHVCENSGNDAPG
jgi:hypothetical protein